MICPTCQQNVDKFPDPVMVIAGLECSPIQRRILMFLVRRFGVRCRVGEVIDRVYANCPEGGPDNANVVISRAVGSLRETLPEYGLTINGGRGQDGYCLAWSNE